MDPVDAVVMRLRAIWVALLASVVLYVVVAEMMTRADFAEIRMLHRGFIAVMILFVGVAVVLRQRMVRPFEEEVWSGRFSTGGAPSPEQTALAGRWQGGQIVSWILCEAVAWFGFALRFLGASQLKAWPFYAVAVLLMVVWTPRRPG